jgi:FAD/FMN-containing dehydrogenase
MIDEGWSDSVLVWNGVVASIPALVVRPASPSDLGAAVAFAREHGLPLRVGLGGHAGERCLTVDLSHAPP